MSLKKFKKIDINLSDYSSYLYENVKINNGYLSFDKKSQVMLDNEIKKKNEEMGLSRMVSGYYVKWISKTNKELFDFENEGYRIKWNTKYENWLNSPDAINEIGCVHTIQGHDLNYVGVIIGNDLKYNSYEKKLYVDKKNFYDNNAKPIKGSPNEEEDLLRYIKNSYYVLLTRGIKGLYIYIKDSELKKYFMENLKF